ncbi:hypothetical protein vseg_007921 [Gypsophila vaccaria]
MSVNTYYGNLKVLWDAIGTHESPFACKCGKYMYGIAKEALARQDSERLHKYFMGLDASLDGNIRSNQLALDPLPSLNRVYHLVLREERFQADDSRTANDPSNVMACVVQRKSVSSFSPDWRVLREQERQEPHKLSCSHCQATGHEGQSCFIKSQKFLDWWVTILGHSKKCALAIKLVLLLVLLLALMC